MSICVCICDTWGYGWGVIMVAMGWELHSRISKAFSNLKDSVHLPTCMNSSYWKSLTYICIYFSSPHLKCKHLPKTLINIFLFICYNESQPNKPLVSSASSQNPSQENKCVDTTSPFSQLCNPRFLGPLIWAALCYRNSLWRSSPSKTTAPGLELQQSWNNSIYEVLMAGLIFVGEAHPPSNGLLRNTGGWERDTGNQSAPMLRVKSFWAMAKAPKVLFHRKFLPSPSSHLTLSVSNEKHIRLHLVLLQPEQQM